MIRILPAGDVRHHWLFQLVEAWLLPRAVRRFAGMRVAIRDEDAGVVIVIGGAS